MRILFYFVIIFVAFILYVRFLEKRSVFFPTKEITATPQAINLIFEDVYFKNPEGLTLHGWLIKDNGPRTTLIFLHGNAGNISDRLEKIHLFFQMGLNVFIFDYRGYGRSEGIPSEEGLYQDALATYDYLVSRKDLEKEKFIAYGASLGGAVAIDLAVKRPLRALIIDSSFTSAADMAKKMYFWVPSFLLQTKLDSQTKIKKMEIPKLFIHSPEDEVVPIELGRKLFEAAVEPKIFLQLKGTHNDSSMLDQEKFRDGISNFLKNFNLI